MRVTSKGQVTIPQELREKHGLTAGTEVEFVSDGGVLALRRAWTPPSPDELDAYRARLRAAGRGMSHNGLTSDEVMQLTRGDD